MNDIFYDDSRVVTIFNRSMGGILEDDCWYMTVLRNVRVVETAGKNISTSGLENADSVKVHIMLDDSLAKPYLEPKAWAELLDKTEAFTLTQGNDFLVTQDVSGLSVEVPDLYQYLRDNYDGVYRITTVDRYKLIPHLEVGGR